MSSSGGTLNGVIPPSSNHNKQSELINGTSKNINSSHICDKCGLQFNSDKSLQVHHMHFHQQLQDDMNQQNNWAVESTTLNASPTSKSAPLSDLQNHSGKGNSSKQISIGKIQTNNSAEKSHHLLLSKSDVTSSSSTSGANTNSTISAAADSSDNQPSTPKPSLGSVGGSESISTVHNYNTAGITAYHQEMHPYPSYMHSYEQYYHPPPSAMDYGSSVQNPSAIYGTGNGGQALPPPPPSIVSSHQEYKLVPSPRYHPYLSGSNNQQQTGNSTASNSSLSPRVVSSSSPTQNAMIGQTTPQESAQLQIPPPQGQPTPSPSPKQCDKCGQVCETHAQLTDHYAIAHGNGGQQQSDALNRSNEEPSDIQNQYSTYQPYIKDEPSSDILDLDSQKMVYPNHDPTNPDALPPMHSMHPMHRPLMWGPEMHAAAGYMTHPHAQPDMKQASYYSPLKQGYPSIKQEYLPIKQEYVGYGPASQIIKSEYAVGGGPGQLPSAVAIQQSRGADIKQFTTELPPAGNPSSSPSEFPSTTTPHQENGPQFRGFEPPTSSLPSNSGSSGKSATWKSNEARRPKTYNCTACNKWFTSSGHLKRHYNTTLHKNAVKSSGQPDPATMPISAHHHPSRDPNSKHHRNSQTAQQPPPAPPEPPRSPEYTPQYTPPPSGFSQPGQGFQQYANSNTINSNSNGHPNGLAGPSVQASQPRGLLIYSTTTTANMAAQELSNNSNLDQEEQEHHQLTVVTDQGEATDLFSHQALELQQQHQVATVIQPQQQPQQSQQHHHQPQIHIISMPTTLLHQQGMQHQESCHLTTTTPTTTTIINTMDQQQYIISPITINTTTTTPTNHHTIIQHPSFQHMQLTQEEHQNYHTIIGNNDDDGESLQLQLSTFDQLQQHIDQQQQQQQQAVISTTTALVPSIAAIRRFTGGVAAFQGDTAPPFSPDVPETYHLQPQHTNNITSTNLIVIGGRTTPTPQMAATAPESPAPCSPSITSTQHQYNNTSDIHANTIYATNPKTANNTLITSSSNTYPRQTTGTKPTTKRQKSRNSVTTITATSTTSPESELGSGPNKNSQEQISVAKHRCEQCDKVFNKSCYLTQHNKTFHSGEKPFKCQRCGKRFPCDVSHEEHFAKHLGNKPFKCTLCPKEFNHKTDLRRHMCLHSGTKPFACDICGKGFIRKDHMVKHGETHRRKSTGMTGKASKKSIGKIIDKSSATVNVLTNSGGMAEANNTQHQNIISVTPTLIAASS